MKTKMIVVVNGRARTGKDTLVAQTSAWLGQHGVLTEELSSIKPVWDWLKSLGAEMDKKTSNERDLAAAVKSALEGYDWLATRACMKDADRRLDNKWPHQSKVLFLHMREPAAIQFAKTICPEDTAFATVFLSRPGVEQINTNSADRDVEKMDYDFYIENHAGLEELNASCRRLAEMLLNEMETP